MPESQPDFSMRLVGVIGVCTTILTASFVGMLSLVAGDVPGLFARIPWYIVVAAVCFVGTILLLEDANANGRAVIVSAVLVGAVGLLAVLLSAEGVLYAITYPERVFVSQLVVYLFAAGLIGTGVGYWALNHWREFTKNTASSGL